MTDTRLDYELDGETFQLFVPEGFEGRPTSALEVLQRARKVLEQEGVWVQGAWFANQHPEVDPQDAFCNNWQACMDGALVAAGVGAWKHRYDRGGQWESSRWESGHNLAVALSDPLLNEARRYVLVAASTMFSGQFDSYVLSCERSWRGMSEAQREDSGVSGAEEMAMANITIPGYNDGPCKTRDQAVEWLDAAIVLAKSVQRLAIAEAAQVRLAQRITAEKAGGV